MHRILALVVLGGVTVLLWSTTLSRPALAQKKKDSKEVQELEAKLKNAGQIINRLEAEVRERENFIRKLQLELKTERKEDTKDDKELLKLRLQVKELQTIPNAPFVHAVVFKLKSNTSSKDTEVILKDINTMLAKIPGVRSIWAGPPVKAEEATPEVARQDYSLGMIMVLDNSAALKRYLEHETHKQFLNKHKNKFETPVVYDFQRPRVGE